MTENQITTNDGKNPKEPSNIIQEDDLIINNHFFNNKFLKISTHNVTGFNLETKQREFFNIYKDLNIDIIGITETKIEEKK